MKHFPVVHKHSREYYLLKGKGRIMKQLRSLCLLVLLIIPLFSCKEKGAAEKTGERVDEIVDNVKEGEPPLKKKGALEKMGESVDETLNPDGK